MSIPLVRLAVPLLLAIGVVAASEPATPPAGESPAPAAATAQATPAVACPGWPFDAKEAAKRQDDAAKALGKPKVVTIQLGKGVAIEFILIPAGSYLDDAHKIVTVGKPFYIGKFKVTQPQYQQVVGNNPAHYPGDTNPVDSVDWNGATAFCEKMSTLSKRPVRLPGKVEREFACRAGTATRCYWGDDMASLNDYCWWSDNCDNPMPVGEKVPNAFGLYDMMGLLWEWCSDPAAKPGQHLCGGATWGSKEPMFKSSITTSAYDNMENKKGLDRFGFRVVMDAE